MQPLTISLIQGHTRWHDRAGNCAYYGDMVRQAAGRPDLVILPETFLTGFTNAVEEQSESMDGEGLAWMRALAADTGAVITGSLVIEDAGKYFNRLFWVRPDGSVEHYDKRHLFRMADEHTRYAAGERRHVVELKGWRVLPLVCYDLRFPVWMRNYRRAEAAGGMDYDLTLFVANWPAPRRHAWRTLLRARAIENLAYCVGVNRVGKDGNGIDHAGDSAVLDMRGEPLVELGPLGQTATVTLDPASLLQHRERFPAWMDADSFVLSDAGPADAPLSR